LTFVLDASVAVAFVLAEPEQAAAVELALGRLESERAVVPAIWQVEVGNALVFSRRRERISDQEFRRALEDLMALPIDVDPGASTTAFQGVVPLAQAHGLTVYDACYLELALRRSLPLATLDGSGRRQGLVRAAEAANVRLLLRSRR
jgi:predicted nucleic acid-binding protein